MNTTDDRNDWFFFNPSQPSQWFEFNTSGSSRLMFPLQLLQFLLLFHLLGEATEKGSIKGG